MRRLAQNREIVYLRQRQTPNTMERNGPSYKRLLWPLTTYHFYPQDDFAYSRGSIPSYPAESLVLQSLHPSAIFQGLRSVFYYQGNISNLPLKKIH